jgi:hypothetical protein
MSGVYYIFYISTKTVKSYNTVGTGPSLGVCVWNVYKLSVKLEKLLQKKNQFGINLNETIV